MWPYRKDTLADIQATLSRFQDNLILALQCAGFDGIARKVDDLRPSIEAISNQTTNIEQSISSQAGILSVIRRDVSDVSQAQYQHDLVLAREMSDLRAQIATFDATVRSRVDVLVSSSNQILRHSRSLILKQLCSASNLRDPSSIPPSLLTEAAGTLQHVGPKLQASVAEYNTRIHHVTDSNKSKQSASGCSCRLRKKRSFQRRRWMSVLSEEIYQHDSGCPRFAHTDYIQSVAAQFMLYNRFLGLCIQAGWQSSRLGGFNTIAPMLRYSTVVSRNTGAFKILNDAQRA
jgi:hypothetical protein